MLSPLHDVSQVVQLISDVSGTPPEQVRQRLLAEAAEIGTNVYQEMREQQIPLYTASDHLDQFYQHSDAFLYETTVWNCCSAKQRMRDFVASRLQQLKTPGLKVFCFGDGLGFDSTHLALQGHQVQYFEPSLRCQKYAEYVFQANAVSVGRLASLEDLPPASLDAIVCLDVLEHVPEPEHLVRRFHEWLKPDGLLLVHAPFWCIHWTRSTHLKKNQRFSGNLSQLYHAHGFQAVDASIFWDPIVFQKTEHPEPLRAGWQAKLRIQLGRLLLTSGRWDGRVHTWIARQIARPSATWKTALQNLKLR